MIYEKNQLQWRKSSRCGNNACVEVAATDELCLLRDSKNPGIEPLQFGHRVWAEFIGGVADGEFDSQMG